MNKVLFLVLVAFYLLAPAGVRAQSNPQYVPLGRANGVIYRPDSGTPHVAFLVMHRTGNFLKHPACGNLSQRGFMVLCMESSAVNNESIVDWDLIMLDVAAGVTYLRHQPGITKVVLFGHSGGGSVMGAYQATAEKGFAYCRAPGKLAPCGDRLESLPRADAVVFADAHPSDAVMSMRDENPSIVAGADGRIHVQADLDPFSPANGYSPQRSHYSADFQQRYERAQAARWDALVDEAKKKQADIHAHGLSRTAEDLILMPTTKAVAWIAYYDSDVKGARQTARPEKLLRNDGSVVIQKITSVAVTTGAGEGMGARQLPGDTHALTTLYWTLRAFLSQAGVRAKDSVSGIDYCSTNSSSICAAQFVSVPSLVAAMGAFTFVRDSELLFDHLAATDKDFIVVEGAVHDFAGCKVCGNMPDQYANAEKNFFDYVRDWTNRHLP